MDHSLISSKRASDVVLLWVADLAVAAEGRVLESEDMREE